ncbi:acyl-CoA carboxylase subunit epsilon [Streptomyces sp. NPDC060000]|uniref:acyl-CoA carboxylase subunit epsilon n=1 Tax=Streptomyces sp. NPDC060000 TaxID=3347031 RepID=UPI00369A81DF
MPATGLLQHFPAPSEQSADATVRVRDVVDVVVVVPGLGGPADDGQHTGTRAGSGAAAPDPAEAAGPAPAGPAPRDQGPHPVTELVRVHRGRPTAEELAAVIAVLLARADAAGPLEHAPLRSAPRWRRHDRGLGYRTAHSWQSNRRPRRAERGAL